MALTSHPTDEILQVTVEAEDEVASNNGDASTLDSGNHNNDSKTGASDYNNQTKVMEVTPDYPVYVEGKGWVWAENLIVGDRLRRADESWGSPTR